MANDKVKILIPFYSMTGHTLIMAQAIAGGVEAGGGEAILKQVAELIPEDKWDDNMKKTKEAMKDIPVADPRADLQGIDGVIVGTPTRFGNMTAQMRNFWDQTGGDWMKGTLIGKPAAVFTGSSTQHGGQETTIMSTILTLLHHGCVIVGLPYSNKEQMTMDEITGGSPYGVSTITGPMGKRMPSENEKKMAMSMGKSVAEIAAKLR